MSGHEPPDWLEGFQARFSSMLRTPLDRGGGTLRDRAHAYADDACGDALPGSGLPARARLAAYNRQYWFRLFDVLQREYPLTTRVLGAWAFNAHAARFLEHTPPRDRDLARAADGFAAHLAASAPDDGVPQRAVVQAARIDDAVRGVLGAPEQARFAPTAAELADLASKRLAFSDAVRVVEEDWPLLKLRDQLRGDTGEAAVALPPQHASTHHWAVCRTETGYEVAAIDALQATLLDLFRAHTVGDALAQLEQAHAELHDLAERTQRWLAQGVRLGFWTGLAA